MKKLVALVLCLMLALGCMSFASAEFAPVSKDELKVGFVFIGDVSDKGYTYAHGQGVEAMKAALGLSDEQVIIKTNVPEDGACENAIRELIEQGCQIIYGNSYGYMNYMEELAEEYPEVIFSHCSGYKSNDVNFNNYFGAIYQARYLSGIAAGMKTKSNKIGFVAAMQTPEVIGGFDAFARLLDKSENQVDYRLAQIQGKYDLEDDNQRVAFLQEAAQMISTLHSAVEREIYGGHAAQTAGVTPETMAQEVNRALKSRLRKEKKQQERRDLAPASQLQPKNRGLRYENIRSARAEEGIVRLVLLDPSLLARMEGLTGSEFSSPLLGKVFDLLRRRAEEGLSTHLAALAEELTGEEMDHMAQVAAQPESMARAEQSIRDYISVIRGEGLLRSGGRADDLLLAAQKKYLEKKAYMEEKP